MQILDRSTNPPPIQRQFTNSCQLAQPTTTQPSHCHSQIHTETIPIGTELAKVTPILDQSQFDPPLSQRNKYYWGPIDPYNPSSTSCRQSQTDMSILDQFANPMSILFQSSNPVSTHQLQANPQLICQSSTNQSSANIPT